MTQTHSVISNMLSSSVFCCHGYSVWPIRSYLGGERLLFQQVRITATDREMRITTDFNFFSSLEVNISL